MTNFEKALAIVSERGNQFSQVDQMAVDRLLNELPITDAVEAAALIFEGIELIISSPDYEGDIAPTD